MSERAHKLSDECWCHPVHSGIGGDLPLRIHHKKTPHNPRHERVLLRDTPEDRERLVAALLVIGPDRALMDSPERSADAILAALRGAG